MINTESIQRVLESLQIDMKSTTTSEIERRIVSITVRLERQQNARLKELF